MQRIVDSVLAYSFIDEVVIWNNDPEVPLCLRGENVRVVSSPRNVKTFGRYLCAYHARNDVIYTQDDDWIVGGIREIYDAFRRDSSRIAHGLHPKHFAVNRGNVYETAQMSLVGWGALFRKEWIEVFDRYVERYGYDDVLLREADRVFSLLLNRRHTSLLVDVVPLSGANDERALWRQEEHRDAATEAVRRALGILGLGHLDPVSPVFRRR